MGSHEIASDIVFEILTRTSLPALDSCKSVCKEWNQMIYESSFMPTYCERTRNLYGFFVQELTHNQYSSMFVTVDDQSGKECSPVDVCMDKVEILASCNQGILCCVKRAGYNHRYYACKPATKQWQCLPNPKLRYRTAAVAITVLKSSPLRYKIIRLSNHDFVRSMNMYKYRCEIFDSQDWKWREAQPLLLPYSELIYSNPSACCGGSFHWRTTDDNVLQFNQEQEYFDKFPLPKPVVNNMSYRHKSLCNYQGKLGFTCSTPEGNMELWVAETRTKWTKKMSANLENLERDVTHPCPASFYNADIALAKAFGEVVFYKLQDRSFSKVELKSKMRAADEVFQFRSDLKPVELKGGESKAGNKRNLGATLRSKCSKNGEVDRSISRKMNIFVPSLILVGMSMFFATWNLM